MAGNRGTLAYLGLGANLGNPRQQLRQAVEGLRSQAGVEIIAISSLYKTVPIGGEPQSDFLNAVVAIATVLSAHEVYQLGQELERRAGRVHRTKNAPRELDIDILLYDEDIIQEPDLQVPHPRLAERAFVLWPMAEVAPEARHPVLGENIAQLTARISSRGVDRLPGRTAWLDADKE
ncbi:2-amino-4-hydroxy-6-hydroxymethyldihydropteridine diphosphokinase [bacterium]|nr:2-amino-4-hydroxy-6-hydroxymethyldihydropteridine diphosphokinase [bacterium]